MSYEQLVEVNPERLIIMIDENNDEDLNKLQNSNQWDQLDAVKNNNVHFVNEMNGQNCVAYLPLKILQKL